MNFSHRPSRTTQHTKMRPTPDGTELAPALWFASNKHLQFQYSTETATDTAREIRTQTHTNTHTRARKKKKNAKRKRPDKNPDFECVATAAKNSAFVCVHARALSFALAQTVQRNQIKIRWKRFRWPAGMWLKGRAGRKMGS